MIDEINRGKKGQHPATAAKKSGISNRPFFTRPVRRCAICGCDSSAFAEWIVAGVTRKDDIRTCGSQYCRRRAERRQLIRRCVELAIRMDV